MIIIKNEGVFEDAVGWVNEVAEAPGENNRLGEVRSIGVNVKRMNYEFGWMNGWSERSCE